MGCCTGDREKHAAVRAEQKWDYIVRSPVPPCIRSFANLRQNLDDFKSHSCWTYIAYGYVWIMLLVSFSIYCVDTFVAVNLLAFDRWAGQIKPAIPLHISRWIFAGCIILSFILLFFRWLRAIRVMRQAGVANSYLDPLAVRIQSARFGKEGRGWKRFLVFAELTKSKKGADYVALFAHYSFEAWLRILLAEGPRQVVNAVTLYSVMQLSLVPKGDHDVQQGHTPIIQFFVNVGVLADSNKEQAVILFGMLWTVLIWVISMLQLLIAVILYLLFLWHHIPSADGSLTKYCRRKINGRLERIVKAKVDKAIAKETAIRVRQQAKEGGGDFKRQPTLPNLDANSGDGMPALSRQTTMTTLPEYSSRPQTGRNSNESLPIREPTLPNLGNQRPGPPTRTVTHGSAASWQSYDSNAPLMDEVGGMGYSDRPGSAASMASGWGPRPVPNRSMTGMSGVTQSSQRSFSPVPGQRPGMNTPGRSTPGTYQMEPLSRSTTNMSSGPPSTGPMPFMPQGRRTPSNQSNPSFTSNRAGSAQGQRMPPKARPSDESLGSRTPVDTNNPYFPPILEGRNSPAPSMRYQASGPPRSFTPNGGPPGRSMTPTSQPALPRVQTQSSMGSSEYVAFSPSAISSQTPVAAEPATRSFSRPGAPPPAQSYNGRQTPQSTRSAYPPSRAGTAPPGGQYDSVQDIYDRY